MRERRRIVVDGEEFFVWREDEGSVHYDWASGPNLHYGFSSSLQGDDDETHVGAIRDFLGLIDPATGYIPD